MDKMVYPENGGRCGTKVCASAADWKNACYFAKVVREDSTETFIYAMTNDAVVSVNSVPPRIPFAMASNQASLAVWGAACRAAVYHGRLERAGAAASGKLEALTPPACSP
jgi:hypothetical protein